MKKHLWITMCEDGSYAQTKVRPTKGNYGWIVTGENGWLYDSYNFFDLVLEIDGLAEIIIDTETKTYEVKYQIDEGFYMADHEKDGITFLQFKDDQWFYLNTIFKVSFYDLEQYTISKNKVPDECIIKRK